MKIDKISKKICEEYKKQELNRQKFLTRIMKPTNPYERETQLKEAYEFIEDFTRQINRSIMVENQILITELNNIKKLLNDLYEGIDEYYTETLERNDELAVARADAQLKLIKEIIEILQKHSPNREIIFLSGNRIYTVKSDDPDQTITLFSQKYLDNIAVMHLKREL